MDAGISSRASSGERRQAAGPADYLSIARLDHITKQVFILPGLVLAHFLRPQAGPLVVNIALGLVAAVCIASANYVINEWLDREFDRHHPTKSARSAVQKQFNGTAIFLEWLLLCAVGLGCALAVGGAMFAAASLFVLQGIVYNVRPLRSKDKPYLDVVSESINNPLRLIIGWAMVDATTLPPSSIICAYWTGGAFLMAAKRLSEYREIVAAHGKDLLERYRASFRGYDEISLTVSCFVYGLLSSFFLAVFLTKYRIEYILLLPPIIVLFAQYLWIAMKPGSSAQNPEKLHRERGLILTTLVLIAIFVFTSMVDLPFLSILAGQRYIRF